MFLSSGEIINYHNLGYINVSGWSSGCVSGHGYRLRVGHSIQRYTNAQASHESIHMKSSPSIVEPIPDTGYPCVPGAIYLVDSIESGASSIYNIMISPTEEGILRGINVLGAGLISGDCRIAISVVQPVLIKPNDYYAKLQFHKDPQQLVKDCGCPHC